MKKGECKRQDPNEIRECVDCKERKIVTEFVKGKGCLYRYLCKLCRCLQRRTGKTNEGKFKPGHDKGIRFRKGHRPWHQGKKDLNVSEESKKKEHRFQSWQYNRWRDAVFERDNHRCVKCGSDDRLCAHHIKSWNECFELRFDVHNGMSLCCSCHGKEEGFKKGRIPWNKNLEHSQTG